MSDSVQSSNRKLSDEAKQLEKAGQFAEAAELYKQVCDSYPGSFVTSHYIRCLRKQGKPMEAYDFAMQLDRERLLSAQSQLNGQQRIIGYQEWLCKVIESLYGLKRNDECMDFARKGIERYPHKQLFYEWYERAK